MVEAGVVVWQMAAALTTMSILPLERVIDRMAASSVTEAACSMVSGLGNPVSTSLLILLGVGKVSLTIMMPSIPACAKALPIRCLMPPAGIL